MCTHKNKEKNRRTCRKCRYAKEKENLIAWSYRTLKSNAKRRGKAFSLTLAEFADFCYETSLLTTRGTKSTSFTVDRIRNEFGYHVGNIQRMTNSENIKKEKVLNYDYQTKTGFVRPREIINPEDYPF
jgi:DNA-directed RNA polymerase subunit M/transcription elongation factor TFIIS